MININLIVLGKLKEKFWKMACDEYCKRMSSLCKINITELIPSPLPDNPSDAQIKKALENEAKEIVSKIPRGSKSVAMCIEGLEMSSKQLSNFFNDSAVCSEGNITFIIGSSYGLDESVKNKCNSKLSMSKMTFPHQLARVMLLEQIYRALMISSNRKYDK